jgi:hypothetical protein
MEYIAFITLGLAILAAPIVGPAIGAYFLKIPVSIKLALVFSGCSTGIYTYVKYREALEINSTYPSSLASLSVVIAEYIFAAYITTAVVSLVGFVRAILLKKPWQTLSVFGLVLTACAVIGEKYQLYVMFSRHL